MKVAVEAVAEVAVALGVEVVAPMTETLATMTHLVATMDFPLGSNLLKRENLGSKLKGGALVLPDHHFLAVVVVVGASAMENQGKESDLAGSMNAVVALGAGWFSI